LLVYLTLGLTKFPCRMFSILYPWAYLASLTGLVLWFFYQDKPKVSRGLSKLFLIGFAVYAVTLAFGPGAFANKLWVLFRDMMVMGVASQVFLWVKRSSWSFVALLILTYGLFFTFYKPKMLSSFDSMPPTFGVTNPYAEDAELLVQLAHLDNRAALANWASESGYQIESAFNLQPNDQTLLDEYFTVNLPSGTNAEEVIEEMMELELVVWAEPNEKIMVAPLPGKGIDTNRDSYANDPQLKEQWGLSKLQGERLHKLIRKNAKQFSSPALIAILDTGVDSKHEDLGSKFRSIDSKSDSDNMGHGTHCAGIAGAISNNGIGITSLDPDGSYIQITSVKVLNGFGGGTQQSIIKGMIKAADAGAAVISMSLGGVSNQKRQKAYKQAVEYCNAKGAIVICAAGNSSKDAKNYSPANAPGVITVSAVNETLDLAPFSNTVNNVKMGIATPGTNILSTIPNNEYKQFNGTSMATPFVASLVGLLKSLDPSMTTSEAYALLHDSGQKLSSGKKSGRLIQPASCLDQWFAK